jgi:Fe-S cluster biogenesis protein NfuA
MNDRDFQERTEKIAQLVERANNLVDEEARTIAFELLQSLMDMHGAVVSRIVEVLAGSGEAGRSALASLGSDPLICGLLVLYGVHPVAIEDRVTRAIDRVRAEASKTGGSVELVGLDNGVVRLKIHGSGAGGGSPAESLRRKVEQAVLEAAPDVIEIIAEGGSPAASGFVPLNMIQPASKKENKYEESAA